VPRFDLGCGSLPTPTESFYPSTSSSCEGRGGGGGGPAASRSLVSHRSCPLRTSRPSRTGCVHPPPTPRPPKTRRDQSTWRLTSSTRRSTTTTFTSTGEESSELHWAPHSQLAPSPTPTSGTCGLSGNFVTFKPIMLGLPTLIIAFHRDRREARTWAAPEPRRRACGRSVGCPLPLDRRRSLPIPFRRHVVLPPDVAKLLPKGRLLSEASRLGAVRRLRRRRFLRAR